MAKKKTETTGPPYHDVDLMFWQYVQGAKDAINQDPTFAKINEKRLELLISEKKKHITNLHKKAPSYNLQPVLLPGGTFDVVKTKA